MAGNRLRLKGVVGARTPNAGGEKPRPSTSSAKPRRSLPGGGLLLVDRLYAAGRLSEADYDVALQVRELYERTSFRAHVTAAYSEKQGRTTSNPRQEEVDDVYRHLESMVLHRSGRLAWRALRAIVVEDQMTNAFAHLPAALAEAEAQLAAAARRATADGDQA